MQLRTFSIEIWVKGNFLYFILAIIIIISLFFYFIYNIPASFSVSFL